MQYVVPMNLRDTDFRCHLANGAIASKNNNASPRHFLSDLLVYYYSASNECSFELSSLAQKKKKKKIKNRKNAWVHKMFSKDFIFLGLSILYLCLALNNLHTFFRKRYDLLCQQQERARSCDVISSGFLRRRPCQGCACSRAERLALPLSIFLCCGVINQKDGALFMSHICRSHSERSGW